MPGDCEREVWPAIEEASGEQRGRGLELIHCPEFVARHGGPEHASTGVRGYRQPGGIGCKAGAGLLSRNRRQSARRLPDEPGQRRDHKARIECGRVFKITCANLLAQICQRIPGADVDEITRAVGGDSRIGGRFFRGGLGYAGPCFPRDVQSLRTLCAEPRLGTDIPDSVDRFNRSIPERLFQLVVQAPPEHGTVAVLGLGYRAGTGVDRDSQAVDIVNSALAAHPGSGVRSADYAADLNIGAICRANLV